MRRYRLLALITALCILTSGCTAAQQVENQAFIVLLGIDLSEDGALELTAKMPKISGSSGEEKSKGGSESNYLTVSARGTNFSDALELLSITVPRQINLTQVKMIVVSEHLARNDRFEQLLWEMAETYWLYATSYLVVCLGKAGEFVDSQEPVIGTRVSTALIALLDHYSTQGYTPESTFADLHYNSNSVYSDQLAILAGLNEQSETEAISETPAEVFPNAIPSKSENQNEYAGAAIFKEGIMLGRLNARQMLFTNLLRGRIEKFGYSFDGNSMWLTPKSSATIKIDTSQTPMRIRYEQTLQVDPLTEMPDIGSLEMSVTQDILEVIGFCQQLKAEPFKFAEIAAAQFLTLEAWNRYDWHRHFEKADVQVKIKLEKTEY